MEWPMILALMAGVTVILFPAAFVWYLNLGGIYAAFKEARARKTARKEDRARDLNRHDDATDRPTEKPD